MLDAAGKALAQMLTPALRAVLWKAIGLALVLIAFVGILLQRLLSALAESGIDWAEHAWGVAPHGVWTAIAWMLSILASLGIITGALFLMPTITAFVGSLFVDEVAEAVELEYYPAEPAGHALSVLVAGIEGVKIAVVSLAVYLLALPFLLFAGLGLAILFLASAYLLSREYFELAAMRFRPPTEARALRRANAGTVFMAGMVIAVFVSIPVINLATPIFAMAFMVHIHKRLAGKRAELVEAAP